MRLRFYEGIRRPFHLLMRLLYRIELVGRVPRGPSVVVANHESVLDPPLVALVAAQPLRFLAKEELWRIRPLGVLIDALGAIPVGRGRDGHAALERAAELIRDGWTVMIFPEGTVSGGPWIRGAARLAIETGVPLVPVRIVGSGKALSRGRIGFPKIRIVVGEAVPVEQGVPTVASARDLTRELKGRVDALR
ncbi:MAG TPA: lysophospholipid acyltransferase family protein [Gaiellaceae bacterium]|nr:lysophospholipid acyltransferase family protein [Gaiellaceae bacterium]